tara:strand:+ start:9372 stop:9767 length:396 start_codon:yes stop_codon:yes gene_type:complete
MRVLVYNDIYSLSKRGYINYKIKDGKISDLPRNIETHELMKYLNILVKYNITPSFYIYLLCGLSNSGKKQLIRFICLQWHNVAISLNDIQMDNLHELTIHKICEFFMEEPQKDNSHRIYFFIEIIYQYFFP